MASHVTHVTLKDASDIVAERLLQVFLFEVGLLVVLRRPCVLIVAMVAV
jgi:hypothetical protein